MYKIKQECKLIWKPYKNSTFQYIGQLNLLPSVKVRNFFLKGFINKSYEFIIEMSNILFDNKYYRTDDDLDPAKITYSISADLVETALENDKFKNKTLWLGSVEVFAMALSSYENMLEKRLLDQRETEQDYVPADHLQVFQEKRNLMMGRVKQILLLEDVKKHLKVCI